MSRQTTDTASDQAPVTVHATAIAWGASAALIRGPSGSGKSDLAIRVLALSSGGMSGLGLPPGDPRLIADDQVQLHDDGTAIVASAPPAIAGLIEVRSVGILAVPARANAPIALVVDLVSPGQPIERLPDTQTAMLLGRPIPRIDLAPFEPSAAIKLVLALSQGCDTAR